MAAAAAAGLVRFVPSTEVLKDGGIFESGGVVRNRLEDDDIVDGADDDDDLFVAGGDRRPCRAHEEREHMGEEAGQPIGASFRKAAARADMVESLSIGGDKPWKLVRQLQTS